MGKRRPPAEPRGGSQTQRYVRVAGWHELRETGQLLYGAREVTVLIRPEQLARSPFASSAAPAGAVTGKMTEPHHHGHGALISVGRPGPADAENAQGSV